MKFKILSSLFLFGTLALIFTTTTSENTGYYNNGTSCGTCHGTSANSSTSVSLTGLPATYVAGQTYNLTFTITNSSLTHGGFNILCSGGQFTAGTGSKTNTQKTQITHNSVSATNTWSFTWKAPTSGTTTINFSAVGNAVNNDNNDDGQDQWNTATYSVPGSFPTSITQVEKTSLNCYPNPATSQINVSGVTSVKVLNMFGQVVNATQTNLGDYVSVDLTSLTSGMYLLVGNVNGQTQSASFIKQ